MARLHQHDGKSDFPHGAGPSLAGWYIYETEAMDTPPDGPYSTWAVAHDELMMYKPVSERPSGRRWDDE